MSPEDGVPLSSSRISKGGNKPDISRNPFDLFVLSDKTPNSSKGASFASGSLITGFETATGATSSLATGIDFCLSSGSSSSSSFSSFLNKPRM